MSPIKDRESMLTMSQLRVLQVTWCFFLFSESRIVILMLLSNTVHMLLSNTVHGARILEIQVYFELIFRVMSLLCIDEGGT